MNNELEEPACVFKRKLNGLAICAFILPKPAATSQGRSQCIDLISAGWGAEGKVLSI